MTAFDLKTETDALMRRYGAAEGLSRLEYPFTLLYTIGGPLHVHPQDDGWIACRFEWPEYANGKVAGPLNPYTGKWNWDVETQEELARFEAAIRTILRINLPIVD